MRFRNTNDPKVACHKLRSGGPAPEEVRQNLLMEDGQSDRVRSILKALAPTESACPGIGQL